MDVLALCASTIHSKRPVERKQARLTVAAV